jgi:hypothetical protein
MFSWILGLNGDAGQPQGGVRAEGTRRRQGLEARGRRRRDSAVAATWRAVAATWHAVAARWDLGHGRVGLDRTLLLL